MPKHFHLLVRTGSRPLPRSMRSLLPGYVGSFNQRHRRSGHLLHNRYKSIVCEEEPYFLELVRYIHLNPLRARIVRNLRELARYPYSGHTALVGKGKYRWQDTGAVLGQFGANLRGARRKYEIFVADGVSQGRRAELQGGWVSAEQWMDGEQSKNCAVEGKGRRQTNGFSVGVHL